MSIITCVCIIRSSHNSFIHFSILYYSTDGIYALCLHACFRPFNNPTETYRYYSLPFCHQHEDEEDVEAEAVTAVERRLQLKGTTGHYDGAIKHGQRLGQSLVGDARETSPYQITFLDIIDWRLLCTKTYQTKDLQKFKNAISNYYFFEMFVEDIPMWVR